MKNTLKISVIIPAYNAENYLTEALDSVTGQTMPDSEYEIIIINDGSSDHTPEILKKYAASHTNITIINQKNSGPSAARNAGLAIAKGKYIFFFDADDVLINDALDSLFIRAEEYNADLVIGKYDILNLYKIAPVHTLDDLVSLNEIEKYNPDILQTFALWNKLFRQDIITQYHLTFKPISYYEDGVFVMEYLSHCSQINRLDKLLIH